MSSLNGGMAGHIPPDLDYPCTIFMCSGNIEHAPGCDGSCETWEPTEIQVKLQNMQREFGRNSMSTVGIPQNVPVPVPGIQIDLLELLCRMIALEDVVFRLVDINREEFDNKYLETKLEFLASVLENNKDRVRRIQTADVLGIRQGPGLLGPDGQPLG